MVIHIAVGDDPGPLVGRQGACQGRAGASNAQRQGTAIEHKLHSPAAEDDLIGLGVAGGLDPEANAEVPFLTGVILFVGICVTRRKIAAHRYGRCST